MSNISTFVGAAGSAGGGGVSSNNSFPNTIQFTTSSIWMVPTYITDQIVASGNFGVEILAVGAGSTGSGVNARSGEIINKRYQLSLHDLDPVIAVVSGSSPASGSYSFATNALSENFQGAIFEYDDIVHTVDSSGNEAGATTLSFTPALNSSIDVGTFIFCRKIDQDNIPDLPTITVTIPDDSTGDGLVFPNNTGSTSPVVKNWSITVNVGNDNVNSNGSNTSVIDNNSLIEVNPNGTEWAVRSFEVTSPNNTFSQDIYYDDDGEERDRSITMSPIGSSTLYRDDVVVGSVSWNNDPSYTFSEGYFGNGEDEITTGSANTSDGPNFLFPTSSYGYGFSVTQTYIGVTNVNDDDDLRQTYTPRINFTWTDNPSAGTFSFSVARALRHKLDGQQSNTDLNGWGEYSNDPNQSYSSQGTITYVPTTVLNEGQIKARGGNSSEFAQFMNNVYSNDGYFGGYGKNTSWLHRVNQESDEIAYQSVINTVTDYSYTSTSPGSPNQQGFLQIWWFES